MACACAGQLDGSRLRCGHRRAWRRRGGPVPSRGASPGIPNPRRTNRPLTGQVARLTLIHEEGKTGRCPRVLTDER